MNDDAAYITTAIPYVNAAPHLGFAYELILADVLSRRARSQGLCTYFLTGSDENSLKNVRAALASGQPTDAFVARNAERFRELRGALDLSWDDFIRTSSDPRHRPAVEALWRACLRSGDIDLRTYSGLYCVGCEQFYEGCEGDLCPEHGTRLEVVCEENYFFRLSRYSSRLLELIESGELSIVPEVYRRDVLRFIRSGLRDFSISRSRERAHGWGIPVPDDDEQIVYVWFDALANYISALGWPNETERFRRHWRDSRVRGHVIGKGGVTRFHAIYWPAILLSAGLPLPKTLYVHGYVTIDGKKISKSNGENVDPALLAREVGADALRYYLLRHGRTGQDWNFSFSELIRAYHSELADGLGNLVCRSLRLVEKFSEGTVPGSSAETSEERPLPPLGAKLDEEIDSALKVFRPDIAVGSIWHLIDEANRFIEVTKPWALAREQDAQSRARLETILFDLVHALGTIALHLEPFLPATAESLAAGLGLSNLSRDRRWVPRAGDRIPWCESGVPILFPKREVDSNSKKLP